MFPSSINIAEICITLYDMSGLCIVFCCYKCLYLAVCSRNVTGY